MGDAAPKILTIAGKVQLSDDIEGGRAARSVRWHAPKQDAIVGCVGYCQDILTQINSIRESQAALALPTIRPLIDSEKIRLPKHQVGWSIFRQ